MDGSVTPTDNRPRLVTGNVNYTQIVVDRTRALDGTVYDVMFIGTGGSAPPPPPPAPEDAGKCSSFFAARPASPRVPGGVSGRISEKPPPLAGLRHLTVRPLGC